MKIGFDISQTGKRKAGGGYLAYCLIRALADIDKENDYIQYPTFGDFYFDPGWRKSIRFVNQENFHKGKGHTQLKDAKQFWNYPGSNFEEILGKPDIVQSNNFYCPSGLQHAKLIYVLYDLNFLKKPVTTTETNRIGCFTGVFRASLYADHILSISEYSKYHFLQVFPHYPSENISVVYLASRFPNLNDNSKFEEKPAGLVNLEEDQFWFNVGTLEPRKNQIGLLNAYAELINETGTKFPLVIAGGKGWKLDHFMDVVSDLGLKDNVIVLGYVNEDQLQWLYQNCFAFVYPSIFEGFGLPVLEAMSQGAAVISSNVTSLPEVVGSAGVLIDPQNNKSLSKAMIDMIEGRIDRSSLKKAALTKSKSFSWKKSASQVLGIYQAVFE